jgi:hypothetical protein
MRNSVVTKFDWMGIAITVASLLSDGAASEPAVERDCYGYPVSDTVEISRDMQEILDTLSGSALQDLKIDFWTVESHWIPDSCRVVYCPGVYDTLPRHFYKTWSYRLFTDHEFFGSRDTLHPVVPGQLEIMPGYNGLFARKSTILDLYKECYVATLGPGFGLAPVQKPNQKYQSTNPGIYQFDALGRSSDTRIEPLQPRFTPPTYKLQ